MTTDQFVAKTPVINVQAVVEEVAGWTWLHAGDEHLVAFLTAARLRFMALLSPGQYRELLAEAEGFESKVAAFYQVH